MRLVVDIECDNLYEGVTKIHCIVAKDIDSGNVVNYFDEEIEDGHYTLNQAMAVLPEADEIIGHNFIDYDMRVLEKLYPDSAKLDINKITDTMILSYMLDPHRKKHPDCPPSRLVGDKRVPIGPHSLQNLAYYVGMGKVENEDWSVFTEHMLKRCVSDVEITHKVAKYLGIL